MNFEDRLAELAKQYKQRTDATEEDIRRVSQDFDRARRAKGKAKRSLGLLWGGGAGLSAAAVATWLVVVLMTPAVNQADYGLLDEMLQDTERVQADGGWLRGLMAEPDALGLGGTGDGGQALALSVQVFAVSEDALGESDSLDEVEAETVDGSNDGGASAHVGSGDATGVGVLFDVDDALAMLEPTGEAEFGLDLPDSYHAWDSLLLGGG